MKTRIITPVITSLLVGALILSAGGCGKKVVTAPEGGNTSGMAGGKNIEYPQSETGFSETNLPLEESLDKSGSEQGEALGNLSVNSQEQEMSEEYKITHGRSTQGVLPVYFDFDQAGIRSDMVDVLIQNAEYIQRVSSASVLIEGNCDERGTNEYNLALGEKRAITAKEYLIDLGINPNRIRTVSYGEERPLFLGQDEQSWGFNRRDDFILE